MLVGFKARNHPRRVAAHGALDHVDDRWTPLHFWIPLDLEFGFTLDAAASDDNYLCERYFTIGQDGLRQSWAGERVWVNPPYSALAAWTAKAWQEVRGGCPLVVMLAPANRTEQRWWQEHVEPYRDRGEGLATRFVSHRLNFGSRDNLGAWAKKGAPFGCVLLIWREAT